MIVFKYITAPKWQFSGLYIAMEWQFSDRQVFNKRSK